MLTRRSGIDRVAAAEIEISNMPHGGPITLTIQSTGAASRGCEIEQGGRVISELRVQNDREAQAYTDTYVQAISTDFPRRHRHQQLPASSICRTPRAPLSRIDLQVKPQQRATLDSSQPSILQPIVRT
ncbi:hypothetical protein PHSY_002430 [Pseudozyma hubeiensis SY62]|uniref:Uncharacterized protein n=1 Tax=Pseudozyma hubeiensis (strain SY62) TaxID=1305764 RepID=R9P192_PSEHS|nr:hypothetical protein PHSY_002430 [Pseudozyma hubeiensis SY62]GAC94857.1 hypothetical protein PHSY_002430 [Pseudozyma hubeiensis SY62]